MITSASSEVTREGRLLGDYVEDAARQRLWLQSWLSDKQFIEAGGRILYSIDIDIIKLYTAPNSAQSLRYTRIFRHDPDYLAIALASTVSSFIFFELSKRAPQVIFPPLEAELQDIYLALISRTDEEHKSIRGELDENLRKLQVALK